MTPRLHQRMTSNQSEPNLNFVTQLGLSGGYENAR
eukprot:CAMPEP_0176460742 /NCGR_PEP_ID=MMETSP0127-20121128/34185_1 /TAXON_ID=938130 /ORGANISM="Platyophrya macrostoma, Strain WH" /LENGTH=34 /DNA_ID= /DNA_START= /DNA_END= /DNA_ORIENTATION=